MKARTEGEVAAKPLGDLSPFSRPQSCFMRFYEYFIVYFEHITVVKMRSTTKNEFFS